MKPSFFKRILIFFYQRYHNERGRFLFDLGWIYVVLTFIYCFCQCYINGYISFRYTLVSSSYSAIVPYLDYGLESLVDYIVDVADIILLKITYVQGMFPFLAKFKLLFQFIPYAIADAAYTTIHHLDYFWRYKRYLDVLAKYIVVTVPLVL